jgi:hypothetical protein
MVIILSFQILHSNDNENCNTDFNDVIYDNTDAAAKHSERKLRDKKEQQFSLSRWQQMAAHNFPPMKCVTRVLKCNRKRDEIKRQTECHSKQHALVNEHVQMKSAKSDYTDFIYVNTSPLLSRNNM